MGAGLEVGGVGLSLGAELGALWTTWTLLQASLTLTATSLKKTWRKLGCKTQLTSASFWIPCSSASDRGGILKLRTERQTLEGPARALELKSYKGSGQYFSAYLLGICVPYCPILCPISVLIRTSYPSPFRARAAEVSYHGYRRPRLFWCCPPFLGQSSSPRGATGSTWVRLGSPFSPLFLLPSTQPEPLVEGLSWDLSQPLVRGVRPEMKE